MEERRKGILSKAAAERIGCPELALHVVTYVEAEVLGKGFASDVQWMGKRIANDLMLGKDGVRPV